MQVQGLMEIFDREWCHAYIWTPTGSALWTFRRDKDYWKTAYEVSGESGLYLYWDGTMQRFWKVLCVHPLGCPVRAALTDLYPCCYHLGLYTSDL